MKSIEKKYIIHTISEDLYDEIKDQILNDSVSADNALLFPIMKPAIAHLTMHRALSELSLKVIPQGIFDTTTLNIKEKNWAGLNRDALLKDNLYRDGNAEIKELQEYLDDNASETKYPLYYNSDLYEAPSTTTDRGEFENSEDNGIFVA